MSCCTKCPTHTLYLLIQDMPNSSKFTTILDNLNSTFKQCSNCKWIGELHRRQSDLVVRYYLNNSNCNCLPCKKYGGIINYYNKDNMLLSIRLSKAYMFGSCGCFKCDECSLAKSKYFTKYYKTHNSELDIIKKVDNISSSLDDILLIDSNILNIIAGYMIN